MAMDPISLPTQDPPLLSTLELFPPTFVIFLPNLTFCDTPSLP